MNWTSAIRGLLGAVVAIAFATSGPALAAGIGSTGPTTDIASAAIPLVATCAPGARACPIRITFASGAYSGQAHSRLIGTRSQKWFVLHARAGQAMIVIVEGRGATRGVVYFPNGGSNGQPGGRVFDGLLPVTGDYRIRVTESPMGEAWASRVDVLVVIY